MKSIQNSQGNKNVHFTKCQEACWKDVERAFGVLQSRFTIVAGPARFWEQKDNVAHHDSMCDHNMIIK